MKNQWIRTTDKLPPAGIYVLVHLVKDNWHDSEDPKGVYYDVAKLELGISLSDREKMKKGGLWDETFWHYDRECKRSQVFKGSDEHGNNLVSYSWRTFGTMDYFGQEVDYWMEILPID